MAPRPDDRIVHFVADGAPPSMRSRAWLVRVTLSRGATCELLDEHPDGSFARDLGQEDGWVTHLLIDVSRT
jgi:hypothetical protein